MAGLDQPTSTRKLGSGVRATVRRADKPQKGWLRRIGEQAATEIVVDREAMDREPFAADGGFTRLNKVFGGELENVLARINEEMWRKAQADDHDQ